MDEALKPCPAECLHTVDRGGPSLFRRRGDIFGVYCQTCQCSTEYYSTEAEAITAWNTRADAAPTPKADEVKAVARAVHGELSHIDVMKYLDMPDNTADRVAQAAIAAENAALERAAKVADDYVTYHDKHDDGLSGFDKMSLGASEVAEEIRAMKGPSNAD